MRSIYNGSYFEKYSETGYDQKKLYQVLMPFVTSINQIIERQRKVNFPLQKVLDVGCAKGYIVKMLKETGLSAWGVDISEYAVTHAPSRAKLYLCRVDVEEEGLPFQDGFFDLAISISTFEHLRLRRLPFTLSEIRRVLKNNGLLIVNVPNPLNKTEYEKREHVTMLSKRSWIKLIEGSGFYYRPKLSKLFDKVRVKEIATLYTSLYQRFQLRGIYFHFPRGTEAIVTRLIMLKRRFSPPNFSLIFSKA